MKQICQNESLGFNCKKEMYKIIGKIYYVIAQTNVIIKPSFVNSQNSV